MEKTMIPEECGDVVENLTDSLTAQGFGVHLSFDLQSARRELADPDGCPCPYHGTADCSCQYIVLLVGREGLPPISIVAHGHEERTHLSVSPPAAVPADRITLDAVEAAVSDLLSRTNPSRL